MFCKVLTLVLVNGLTWNMDDIRSLVASAESCKRKHNQCLAKFVKKEETHYHAECKHPKK